MRATAIIRGPYLQCGGTKQHGRSLAVGFNGPELWFRYGLSPSNLRFGPAVRAASPTRVLLTQSATRYRYYTEIGTNHVPGSGDMCNNVFAGFVATNGPLFQALQPTLFQPTSQMGILSSRA
jgi:hypothetical protein